MADPSNTPAPLPTPRPTGAPPPDAVAIDDLARWYDEPPSGHLTFSVMAEPVSLQASAALRKLVRDALAAKVAPVKYLYTEDLQIDIEWLVREELRYETDASPDLDNVLKPMLDGLTGPAGLFIDDSQVQSISCTWIDWTHPKSRLQFTIRCPMGGFIPKSEIVFLHFARALCLPVPKVFLQLPDVLDHMAQRFDLAEQARAKGGYLAAQSMLFAQRMLHRTRLRGFTVLELADARIAAKKNASGP